MDTLTIELREKDAQNNFGNGDWESVVQDKITLEDGDAVVLKSCFLDTESVSNQKVTIDRDITLQYEVGYVVDGLTTFFDDNGTGQDSKFPFNPWFEAPKRPHDEKVKDPIPITYTVCKADPVQIADDSIFQGFDISMDVKLGKYYSAPAFNLEYTYRPFNETEDVTRSILVPAVNYDIGGRSVQRIFISPVRIDVGVPVTFKPSQAFISAKYLRGEVKVNFGNPTGSSEDDFMFEQLIRSFEIDVPAGTYSPTELCNLINTQATKSKINSEYLESNGGWTYYGNPILPSSRLFEISTGSLTGNLVSDVVLLSQSEEKNAIRFNGYDIIFGANQLELSFDDATQLFQFDQAHTSVYDAGGDKIVRYTPIIGAAANLAYIQNNYSQLIFTNLSAKDENGEFYDFWEGKLGFVLEDLISKPTEVKGRADEYYMANTYTTNAANYFYFAMDVTPGKTVTSDLASVDGLVRTSIPHGATGLDTVFYTPFTTDVIVPATSTTNERIIAESSIFNRGDTFGYFLLDIQANMGGSFITPDQNKQSIKAIVGRFYELNSYTTGTQGDGLVYVHRGQPQFLDSFKCRVLDGSTKKVATDLGDDSAIFLQVVKAPKAPPAVQAPPQKK